MQSNASVPLHVLRMQQWSYNTLLVGQSQTTSKHPDSFITPKLSREQLNVRRVTKYNKGDISNGKRAYCGYRQVM